MTKLFVGGFPLDMNELQLVQMISPYGEVSTIKIVRDKKTGKCKGYAFLEMMDKAGAENAIEALDGTMTANRPLNLNIVPDAPPAPSRPASFSRGPAKPRPAGGGGYSSGGNRTTGSGYSSGSDRSTGSGYNSGSDRNTGGGYGSGNRERTGNGGYNKDEKPGEFAKSKRPRKQF